MARGPWEPGVRVPPKTGLRTLPLPVGADPETGSLCDAGPQTEVTMIFRRNGGLQETRDGNGVGEILAVQREAVNTLQVHAIGQGGIAADDFVGPAASDRRGADQPFIKALVSGIDRKEHVMVPAPAHV